MKLLLALFILYLLLSPVIHGGSGRTSRGRKSDTATKIGTATGKMIARSISGSNGSSRRRR